MVDDSGAFEASRCYARRVRWLVVLVIVVPLTELFLLLQIDRLVGFWPTIGLTLVTGFLGGSLAKREGLKVWRSWSAAMSELRPPEQGVIDGLLVLLGGALLITPGVLTDITGFLLLIPPTRRLVAVRVRAVVDRKLQRAQFKLVDLDNSVAGVQVVDTEGVGHDIEAERLPARD